MLETEVSEEDLARVPRISPDCSPEKLSLSPAEGFLLSRIDGQTTWKLLREIGGLSGKQVDDCLEDWLLQGIIDIDGRAPRVKRRPREQSPFGAPQRPMARRPGRIDESLIDESLDLEVAIQRAILVYEQKLGMDYFTILGVERGAESKDIKRAYFNLSKRFHPDLYFRRDVGGYAERLSAIFKRISESYELLSDPVSRAEVEKGLDEALRSAPPSSAGAAGSGSGNTGTPRQLSAVERLRQRMPFKIPDEVRETKTAKGADLFKSAQTSASRGRLVDAASSMRLAVAFDPFNAEYKKVLGEIQAKLALQQIDELLEQPNHTYSDSERRSAERLCEEVLLHLPQDPSVDDRAGRLHLALGNLDRAQEYVERAIELAPEVGAYHRVLGTVHVARGTKGHAVKAFEKAVKLDSGDAKSREMLKALKQSSRR